MKRRFILIIWAGVCCVAVSFQASGQNLPSAVASAFHQQYNAAKPLDWDKIGDKYKIIFFTSDSFYAESIYDGAGNWLYTTTQIAEKELPPKVFANWKKKFPKSRSISAIQKVEFPRKKNQYNISFETTDLLVNLIYGSKGCLKSKDTEPISLDE